MVKFQKRPNRNLRGAGERWFEYAAFSCSFMVLVTAEREWGVDQPAKAYRRDRLFSMNAEGIAIDADMKQKIEEWKWCGKNGRSTGEANSTHIFLLSKDITVLFDFFVPSLFRKIAPSLKRNSIAPKWIVDCWWTASESNRPLTDTCYSNWITLSSRHILRRRYTTRGSLCWTKNWLTSHWRQCYFQYLKIEPWSSNWREATSFSCRKLQFRTI